MLLCMLANGLLAFETRRIFAVLWNVVQPALTFLLIFPTKKRTLTVRIILIFSQLTNLLAVSEIVNDASRLGGMFGASDPLLWTLRSFSSLLLIPCAWLVHRWQPSPQAKLPRSTTILPGVIWLVNLLLYWLVRKAESNSTNGIYGESWITAMVLLFFLAMLMVNLIYCYMLHRTLLQEQLVEMQADVQDRKRVEELIAVSEENVERMREVRHDIRNQFGYLRALADKGDISDVRKYLEELSYDLRSCYDSARSPTV